MRSIVLRAENLTRRHVLQRVVAASAIAVVWPALSKEGASGLPTEVAGIPIPRTEVALCAAAMAAKVCPDYLFNHCMRTFVFGALFAARQKMAYSAEDAFVAAALHDLGLLAAYESAGSSFEIDGANAAEKLAKEAGMSAADSDRVWHGVALHDVRWSITKRAGPEPMVVAYGAGSDVDGADPTVIEPRQTAEIIAAFPRLQFKRRFTALLIDHCKRKPTSQSGTWLEGLCREQVPTAWTDTVEEEIASAPYDQ